MLDRDTHLRQLFKPVAVFDASVPQEDGDEGKEFIAIAEGVDIPMYIFTYQVEMV